MNGSSHEHNCEGCPARHECGLPNAFSPTAYFDKQALDNNIPEIADALSGKLDHTSRAACWKHTAAYMPLVDALAELADLKAQASTARPEDGVEEDVRRQEFYIANLRLRLGAASY